MKTNLTMLAGTAVIAASFLVGCSSNKITDRTDPARSSDVQVKEGYDTFGRKWDKPAAAKPEMMTRNEAMILTYSGTITDIDYKNREMTLKSSSGRYETFSVDKEVRRFTEAKVGDTVAIDYYLGITAEIRKPTAEEEKNPLVVLEGSGRDGYHLPPAAHAARLIRAVVTIEALDRKAQTVTVKGPRGQYFTAHVEDPTRFDKVKIGDTILMTFTEAAAISLKPASN